MNATVINQPPVHQGTDVGLVGVWAVDEGYQIVEFLFRSDGRYQMDIRSTDRALGYASTERGRYQIAAAELTLQPYEFFGEPYQRRYEFAVHGDQLTLTIAEYPQTQVCTLKPGSKEEVRARERAGTSLLRVWRRAIMHYGSTEFTFRPDGYYIQKNMPEGPFEPEYIRGRYRHEGMRLVLKPYSGIEAAFELDVFGETLTVIRRDEYSGDSAAYDAVPGSDAEVRAKAAEAEAFLAQPDWHVGVWEIRDAVHTVDVTIRPDGHYIAKEDTQYLEGVVRGRYTVERRRIHFRPFTGQGLYARSNGEFGKVERSRELDYWNGELQFIDIDSLSQSVTLARKRVGSREVVARKTEEARVERSRPGWFLGIWEVNDPAGWMEFTLRPDGRYIAASGRDRVPGQMERGRYLLGDDAVTLAPYAGLGPARGFETDLYDGDLFLVGDLHRMVVARKVPGSETTVSVKALDPEAMRGERGSILGLWTANLPGESSALVFRPDGEFRLTRCTAAGASHDYGLYTADVGTRALMSESRFTDPQKSGLDFYGETMTIFGGLGGPRTYAVNLGRVDNALRASLMADGRKAQVDSRWMARVPIAPRDAEAVHVPTADIPPDPGPGRVLPDATVFVGFHLYRRLIPGFVYFNVQGTIRTVPVVNTREFYFFPTGRTLVRFRNHGAGLAYPTTVADVSDSWGAYRIGRRPVERDVLHRYADNVLVMEMDSGERIEMTLEDGRRLLFWGRDYQLLSEWASELSPEPCEMAAVPDPRLMNTGISLATSIPPAIT